MPWTLNIFTIDVGQGESSLIIASNTDQGGATRTMLIDGGELGYASTVRDFVRNRLALAGLQRVDVVLTTHFDIDHSGGIAGLLQADIFEAAAEIIGAAAARAAGAAILRGRTGVDVTMAAAAAATAAALGAYDVPGGDQYADHADGAGEATDTAMTPDSDDEAAAWGVQAGIDYVDGIAMNEVIVRGGTRLKAVARAAGIGAGTAPGNTPPAQLVETATDAAFAQMYFGIPNNSDFRTGGIFRNAVLVDPGTTGETPAYVNSVQGRAAFIGGATITVPTAVHPRRQLGGGDLTDEVLWNTQDNGAAAPDGAPAAFVVAANGWMWQVPAAQAPIPGGFDNNIMSIGLVLRFGNFYFYTGGDLPTVGEEAIAKTVMTRSLPNPQGGTFPPPVRFAAFKCGHHGSDGSTSTTFINRLSAPVALISVGGGVFNGAAHPGPATIARLHTNTNIQKFYLTNCQFLTKYVPASFGVNQIMPPSGGPTQNYPSYAPNKSRVAGNNGLPNLHPARARGDLMLEVTQANAFAANGSGRTFRMTYYDDDNYGYGPVGARVENHKF